MNIQVLKNVFIRTNLLKNGRQSIWFLHGFADSGLAYREVFESPLNEAFNLYVLDLPGFGVSPLNPEYLSIKEQADLLTQIIEEETAHQQAVNIGVEFRRHL